MFNRLLVYAALSVLSPYASSAPHSWNDNAPYAQSDRVDDSLVTTKPHPLHLLKHAAASDAKVAAALNADSSTSSLLARPSAPSPSLLAQVEHPQEIEKACQILYKQLDRRRMRSEKIIIGHYTDPQTPPHTKTECTSIIETDVPDPSTCTTEVESCANELHFPFGSRDCIETTTTRCSNIKLCNNYTNYIRTLECSFQVQFKLPDFIEEPISKFVDENYAVIESTRNQATTALPLACVSDEVRSSVSSDPSQSMANRITATTQQRIKAALEREMKQWVLVNDVSTIAASIPTSGISDAAAMDTSLAQFVYRAQRAIEPIIKIGSDTKATERDLEFSTSCWWSDWHQ